MIYLIPSQYSPNLFNWVKFNIRRISITSWYLNCAIHSSRYWLNWLEFGLFHKLFIRSFLAIIFKMLWEQMCQSNFALFVICLVVMIASISGFLYGWIIIWPFVVFAILDITVIMIGRHLWWLYKLWLATNRWVCRSVGVPAYLKLAASICGMLRMDSAKTPGFNVSSSRWDL